MIDSAFKSRKSNRAAVDFFRETNLRGNGAVAIMRRALQDEDAEVRMGAANTLQRLCPESTIAVPDLVNRVRDPDSRVRYGVILALEAMGSEAKAAVPSLIAAVRDGERLVSVTARRALKKIDPDAAAKAGVQ